MKVIVIGGGIGGLCLAQGLRTAGIDVEVHERDAALGSRWEGYRIHVNPAGARSLKACLPGPVWEAFLATSGAGGDFGFLTERLEELLVVEESIEYPQGRSDPGEGHYAVDRATLRRLLTAGLDRRVRFGAEFVRYEHTDDGRVAAVFADGHRAVGDLLVGADGASSRVRAQYLPHARTVPAGVGGVAHKLFLTEQTRAWVPRRLQTGMNLVTTGVPVALFTSVFEPPAGGRAALERVAGTAPEAADAPYVLCALVTASDLLPHGVAELDDRALRHLVDGLVAGWHPDLRRLLAESDPASRRPVEFTVSPQVAPWPSTDVVLLGDAVHTMPATGGIGGNTALRDAHLLTRTLAAVARGERELLGAVAAYEDEMRRYGYAAVRGALAIRDQMLGAGPVRTFAARAFFRACRAVPALRRRSFGPDAAARPRPWELAA